MTKRHRKVQVVGAGRRPPRPEDQYDGGDLLPLMTEPKIEKLLRSGYSVDELVAASYGDPAKRQASVEPENGPVPELDQPDEVMEEEKVSVSDPSNQPANEGSPTNAPPTRPIRSRADARLKYDHTGTCRFCGDTMGVFGLPRHESLCDSNPDRKETADEAKKHTDAEFGRCPRCEKSMLLTSIDSHLALHCPIVLYERRYGIALPDESSLTNEVVKDGVTLLALNQYEGTLSDDDLYAVLEMLAPAGIKPRQIPLINEWMNTTKKLMQELRS